MKHHWKIISVLFASTLMAFLLGEWHGRRAATRFDLWDATCIIQRLADLYAHQNCLEAAQHVHSEMALTNLANRAAFLKNPMMTRADPTTAVPYPYLSWSKELEYVQGVYDRLQSSFAQTGNLLLPAKPEIRNSKREIPNKASEAIAPQGGVQPQR